MAERTAGSGRDPYSLSSLLVQLSRDVSDLVRGEIRLAKAEFHDKTRQALGAAGALIVGLALLHGAFLVLLAAAVMGLAKLLPGAWSQPWISALIVSAVVFLVGFALVAKGRSDISARNLALRRTAENLNRDEEMVKEHVRRLG